MLAIILLAAGLFTFGFGVNPTPAAAQPAEFLEARSPLYQDLEALFARRLVTGIAVYSRPLARADIAGALLTAWRQDHAIEADLHFQRLTRELAREFHEMGWEPQADETGPSIDVGTRDQRFRASLAAHALGDYDETRDPRWRMRDESSLSARMGLQLWPGFGAYEEIGVTRIRGQREFIDAVALHSDVEVALLRGELIGRVGRLTGAAGYDYFRWGPGLSGTLLLSDAAGPMASILLQGSLRGRVAVTGSALSAALSPADRAYHAAHRLEVEIAPRLTLGLAEAVRYSGDGIDLLYAVGIIPYTLIERIRIREASADSLRPAERANVMASADVAWRASPGLTLYGEVLLDDFATKNKDMPNRFGYQIGFRSERPFGPHYVHFLGEYTRVRNYTYSVGYGENFIHRGRPLGYFLGPDVENVAIETAYDLSRDWQLKWSGNFANHGAGRLGVPWTTGQGGVSSGLSGVVESRREVWGDTRWIPRDNVDLSAGLGFRRVGNEGNEIGADREAWLARFAANLRY